MAKTKVKAPTARATSSLSPSECHRHLLKQLKPELAFAGELKSWRTKLRRKLAALVMSNLPEKRPPLKVRRLWTREHELGTLEKIVFTSETHADVPAFVGVPRGASGKLPWAICLQGHSTGMHLSVAVDREDNTQPVEVQGDRDFVLSALRHGFAALAVEQRSFGERREQAQQQRCERSCQEASMHALALGRTLLGERVYDVDRAIDYLLTRADVDPARIGVMGNSGGGTTSLFAAALLPRVQWAMPSCYFCTFKDSLMNLYHCECNYVPGLARVAEMADILGLFAPKPVVVVNGQTDTIFPIDATRRAFRALKKIYTAAGAPQSCQLVVGPEGHRFYADLAWPVLSAHIQPFRPE